MDLYGIIQESRLILSDVQQKLERQWLSGKKDGTSVRKSLTKIAPAKTNKQVKTIFGLVISMIIQNFDDNGWDSSIIFNTKLPTGVPVTKDSLKEYFYAVCPIEDDEGNRKTLSKATIEQAMKFIDDTRNWSASQWSIIVPDPDPNWREKVNKSPTQAAE